MELFEILPETATNASYRAQQRDIAKYLNGVSNQLLDPTRPMVASWSNGGEGTKYEKWQIHPVLPGKLQARSTGIAWKPEQLSDDQISEVIEDMGEFPTFGEG